MTYLIRRYRDGDLPRLIEITVESFVGVSIDEGIERQFGRVGGNDWRWRKARHIAEDVQRDANGVFVAERAEAIVGYVTTWMDPDASLGYIPNLAVTADERGQGLGRDLLQHALQHFKEHGLACARIETLEQNPVGQHLYPSLGFREVARQIHYCAKL